MKIAFIGAGALRILGTIQHLAKVREATEDATLYLMDLNEDRVSTVAAIARKMPESIAANFKISSTTSLEEALDGADFVYTTIRVGGVAGMERDKKIGLEYGLHGHDDFGPSSVFISLRTIPHIINIAREMEKRCPQAWLINLTNPVTVMAEALTRATSTKNLGVCGGDRNLLYDLADIMGWKSPCNIKYKAAGIDHFGWYIEPTYQGKDFYPLMKERVRSFDPDSLQYYHRWTVETFEIYEKALFPSAHCFHWLYHDEMTKMLQEHYSTVELTRSESQENEFKHAKSLASKDLGASFWEDEVLRSEQPGEVGDIGAIVITALVRESNAPIVVNLKNNGSIKNLPDDAIVEISCNFTAGSVEPVSGLEIPHQIAGLTEAIITHQKLVVSAALEQSEKVLYQAFLADPIVRSVPKVKSLVKDLAVANKDYLSWL